MNNNETSKSGESKRIYAEQYHARAVGKNDCEEAWIEETISLLVYEIIREFFEGRTS